MINKELYFFVYLYIIKLYFAVKASHVYINFSLGMAQSPNFSAQLTRVFHKLITKNRLLSVF